MCMNLVHFRLCMCEGGPSNRDLFVPSMVFIPCSSRSRGLPHALALEQLQFGHIWLVLAVGLVAVTRSAQPRRGRECAEDGDLPRQELITLSVKQGVIGCLRASGAAKWG